MPEPGSAGDRPGQRRGGQGPASRRSALSALTLLPALLLLLAGWLPPPAFAGSETAEASSGRLTLFLGRTVESFLDPTGTIGFPDILRQEFRPSGGQVVNRGAAPTRTTAFWLRFRVPPDLRPGGYVLVLDEPRTQRARLFVESDGGVARQDWHPVQEVRSGQRSLRLPVFALDAPGDAGRMAYLRIETTSSMRASLWLHDRRDFLHANDQRGFTFGALVGILTGLFIYLLAAGALLPDGTLLRLGALALFFASYVLSDRGFLETLIFPGAIMAARMASLGFTFLSLATWLSFVAQFLRIGAAFPRLAAFARAISAALVACAIWAAFEPLLGVRILRVVMPPLAVGVMSLSLVFAVAAMTRDVRRSLVFIACWLPAIVGVSLRVALDVAPQLGAAPLAVNAIYVGVTFSLLVFGIVASAEIQARERRLRAVAEASETRFRNFAGIASDSVWETDPKGSVRFVSGQAADAAGLVPGQDLLAGLRRGSTIWSAEDLARLEAGLAGRAPFRRLVVSGEGPDGEPRFLAFSGVGVTDSDGDPCGHRGVLSDITADRLRLDRQAQQDKLAALGQLAGGIAHEINNLLHPIVNLTRRVRDGLSPDSPGRYQLGLVHDAAQRAGEIVHTVLDTARASPKGAEMPLRLAVERSVAALRHILPQPIDLVLVPAACDGPPLPSGEVMQVVANLVANASHALDGRGRIEVRVEPDGDGRVALRVGDNGAGMDADVLQRATEPFFTTRSTSGGTGLGLSIVGGIVAGWGGTLRIASTRGVGTTVAALIPAGPGRSGDNVHGS